MEMLNLKYNTCRIDVKVAGQESHGSGFIYLTAPFCDYNYVITAKHIFSEDLTANPVIMDITDLSITMDSEEESMDLPIYSISLKDSFLFHNTQDVAIIRVQKIYLPNVVRTWVKNCCEIKQECLMKAQGFPGFRRNCHIDLDLQYHPTNNYRVKCNSIIKDIQRYHGISGGGVHLANEPYLISVISSYPFEDFELSYFMLAKINWDDINNLLHTNKWHKLSRGASKCTRLANDKNIIDLQEISINKTKLNLDIALKHLRHDMIDDWFFDPLQNVDLCNRDYILEYFSDFKEREQYKFQEMEIFYLPKESLVQRKAMVGNFVDRLLYIAIVGKLAPLMEKYISSRVYAARINSCLEEDSLIARGVQQWVKMNYLIDEWLDKREGCLFKCDIVNFYDNISHDKLIAFLNEITNDPEMLNTINLLKQMLVEISGSNIHCGLPQNSDASSLLATFYLSHIDSQIQAQAMEYCRFMDDIYFMAPNYFIARNVLQSLESELRRLNLCLNSSKIVCVRLENTKEVEDFRKELSLYNHANQKIRQLINSEALGRRENGIALLVSTLDVIIRSVKGNSGKTTKDLQRKKKFLLYMLCNHPLTLMPHWRHFYKNLVTIVDNLKEAPVDTPLICRLISCINPDRDLDEIKRLIAGMLMRQDCDIYPWQAYHFWLLMAFLKYNDKSLIKYAATELERNDRTRRIENAAIIIYLVSVEPNYVRVIMNMLSKHDFHGYMQVRAALIACRSLNPKSVVCNLPEGFHSLVVASDFLNRHKEKELVLMGHVSSYLFKSQHKYLFPDLYSGL